MATPVAPNSVARFGVFELDVRAGELKKRGLRVKLQQQPLKMLGVLLERPGEVITREELRARLWPTDIYVDFDRSLNKAIVKLRDALGDSAESPRFIETLPRTGYRFIAPVDGSPKTPHMLELVPRIAPPALPASADEDEARTLLGRNWHADWLSPRLILPALVLLVFVVGITYWFGTQPAVPRIFGSAQLSNSAERKFPVLVSDGVRLYFSQEVGGLVSLAQISVAGGDPAPIPTPLKNVLIFDISMDGTELLVGNITSQPQYGGEPALWVQPSSGGSSRRVGEVHAHAATWTHDRNQIVYATGSDLYTAKLDGSDSRKFLTIPGSAYFLRWSPDGKRLRFEVHQGKSSSLWEVYADGSNFHPVLPAWPNPHQECCGSWTPDGRYVFQATRDGLTSIWVLLEHGRIFQKSSPEPVRLTTGPMNLMAPLPSKDGKRIYVIGEQRLGELVRYDSASRQFVTYLSGISAEGVAPSRDGQWLAYVGYPEATLWRSRVGGTQKLQLTAPPFRAGVPQWSPDGKWIAFCGNRSGEKTWKLYVVSAQGGIPEQLIPGEHNEFSPWWSPEGAFLAVGGFPQVDDDKGIRIIDFKTHKSTTLPRSEGICCPTWSRDGRSIFGIATSPPRIMRYDIATQKWSEVWRGPFNYYDLSRDEKYIYFDTEWETDPAVFRLRLSDHKLERVVSLQGFRRTRGPLGDWFDIAPDDSPLLLRNLSSTQIFALDWDAH